MSNSIPRVGALARWHAEMRRGIRGHPDRYGTWTLDSVWSAACHEKTAIDFEADGDLAGARYFMDWALLRLHGSKETPDSKAGRALLAKLHGSAPSAANQAVKRPPRPRQEFAPLGTRRRPVTAGLGPMP